MRNLPDLNSLPNLPNAACRPHPTSQPYDVHLLAERFFPTDTNEAKDAKAVCRGCPEQTACLQWALDHHPQAGIWGGTSEKVRGDMHAARLRKRVA